MHRQRQESSEVTQGLSCVQQNPEQQSWAVLLPKDQHWSGHRNLSQRWRTKRQLTFENNVKPQLFILDTSQGLENMKVKIKREDFWIFRGEKQRCWLDVNERTELSGQKYWRHTELLEEKDKRHIQFAVGNWLHLPKWGFNPNDKGKIEYYSVTAECELFQRCQ